MLPGFVALAGLMVSVCVCVCVFFVPFLRLGSVLLARDPGAFECLAVYRDGLDVGDRPACLDRLESCCGDRKLALGVLGPLDSARPAR